jgi:hypothetical protein
MEIGADSRKSIGTPYDESFSCTLTVPVLRTLLATGRRM